MSNFTNFSKRSALSGSALVLCSFLFLNSTYAQDCVVPSEITPSSLGIKHARVSWENDTQPQFGYEWKITLPGNSEVLQSGTAKNLSVLIAGLNTNTEYKLSVRAHCADAEYSEWAIENFTTLPVISNLNGQIGFGASASPLFGSSYGPIMYAGIAQRNGSVANMLFTQNEIEQLKIPVGAKIKGVAFDKISNAKGGDEYPDLRMRMFVKNSDAAAPLDPATTYGDLLTSHIEVMDNPAYDLPAATGWVDFNFDTPFEYGGQGIELATAMYQNGQTAQFSTYVIWQFTAGYKDYLIGAWPINTVPMDENLILSHNSGGGQYKDRPNMKLYYDVDNSPKDITVSTENDTAAEITENQGSLQLISSIEPAYVSQEVVWEMVSGAEFATLDQNGLVKAFANGTVVIRVLSADNNEILDEITITVTNQAPCKVLFPGNVEPITSVLFAGINNQSSAVAGGETPAQEDFTTYTAEVAWNKEYTLTVKGNTNGDFTHYITAYVDWNRNNNFEDEGEIYPIGILVNSTGEDNVSVTGTIAVPADAPLGITKMRVIKKFNSEALSCNSLGYGQAEDYSINLHEEIVVGLDDFSKRSISLYPNPTSDMIYLQSQETINDIEIINSLGQSVAKGRGKEINLSTLSNGIYVLRANFGAGNSETFKIIKK
ncbi:hypothetical protein AMR72_01585 [Flavobacterium psychrophilum]|nr:hypothetical protein AMR72_01585 [Flavobacterium psychrophilum]AOE51328.1 hypothetical protein ALW18_01585 [Flavobacterium psychrophilum]